jgi:MoxR-like ATPase
MARSASPQSLSRLNAALANIPEWQRIDIASLPRNGIGSLAVIVFDAACKQSHGVVVALLRGLSGTIGFDYGPVALALLRTVLAWRIAAVALAEGKDWSDIWLDAQNSKAHQIPAAYPRTVVATPDPSIPVVSAPVVSAPVVSAPPVAPPLPAQPIPVAPSSSSAPSVAQTPSAQTADPVAPITPEESAPLIPAAEVAKVAEPATKMINGREWVRASKVFGVKSLRGYVYVCEAPHSSTPQLDFDYVFDPKILQLAVDAMSMPVPQRLWLTGERGTGKTTFTEQIAARLNRPYLSQTMDRFTERSDLIGGMGLTGGDTKHRKGALAQMIQMPFAVILIDEFTYAQSENVSGPLNALFARGGRYDVPETGESIVAAEGVFLMAGDNTNGTGDPTGRYVGTNPTNAATRDRFGWYVTFTFMPKQKEMAIIRSRSGCNEEIAERVHGVMTMLRQKVNSGALADPPSLREAIAMAELLSLGHWTDAEAFEYAFAQKAPSEAQEEMRLAFTSISERAAASAQQAA